MNTAHDFCLLFMRLARSRKSRSLRGPACPALGRGIYLVPTLHRHKMSKVILNSICSPGLFFWGNRSHPVAFAVFSALLLLGISCDDVIERDIEKKVLILLAPGDSAVVISDTVTLWWEHLDGAREYEVRMASPSLTSPSDFVVDSITTANFLSFALAPGTYEWEVRAINNGYSTAYFYRSFRVDTTASSSQADISGLDLTILLPADDGLINTSTVTFRWESLEGAEKYEVLAVSPDFTAPIRVVADSLVTGNRLTVEVIPGTYEWRVRALNSRYTTSYFYRSFTVDTTVTTSYPDISAQQVSILLPMNNTQLDASQVTFWWEELAGAAEYEIRAVSPDFLSPEEILVDSTITSNKFTVSIDAGDYEWQVRAKNPRSVTGWSSASFSVNEPADTTTGYDDISGLSVLLLAPFDSLKRAEGDFTFWWEEVEGAEEYQLQIVSPDFKKTELLILDNTLSQTQHSQSLDSGNYQWRVRAINPEYKTDWTTYTLFVD